MLGKRFLDHLEKRGLIDEEIVKNLREQMVDLGNKVTPEVLADKLVKNGYLTSYQAKKLIAEVTSSREQQKEDQAQQKEERQASRDPASDQLLLVDDEEIVALEAVEEHVDDDSAGGLTPLDSDVGLTPLPDPDPIPDHAHPGSVPAPSASAAAQTSDPLGVQSLGTDPLADPLGLESDSVAPTSGYSPPMEAPDPLTEESKWGSKLFVGGLGGLLLLTLALVALVWVLQRGSGDDLYGEAQSNYDNLSYSQAIKVFTKYLEDYPTHVKASSAKVLIRFAKIRVAAGERVPEQGLDFAEKLLPEVKDEEDFSQFREELAELLITGITEKLATAARGAEDIEEKRKLLALGDRSMALIKNSEYMTTKNRGSFGPALVKIQEDFAEAKRIIGQDEKLQTALTDISDALSKRDTINAFQFRADLLDEYPSLETDERIVKVTTDIAERESDLVEVTEDPIEALTDDDEERAVILASTNGDAIPGVRDDDVLTVQASGAVYGLQAKTGRVLWQRPVGQDHVFLPTRVSDEPGADTVLVDSRRNELTRVRSQDGELVWRAQVEEPFHPTFNHERLVLATETGKLMELNLDTGQIDRYAKLPQTLEVGPAFDATRPVFFQVGEHSTIYIVDSNTLECGEVYYLGHQAGTVRTTPTMAVGMLFVVENYREDECRIHVLRSTPDGKAPKRAMDPIRIKGNIVVPPIVDRRRILFVSDIRGIHLFQVEPSADPPVQSMVAGVPTSNNKRVHSIPFIYESHLFVADNRLAKYELRETTSELLLQWAVNQNDTFQGSLDRVGGAIISQRQRGDGGVTVTAADINEGQKTIWTTKLGQAAAKTSESFQDSGLVVISSTGDLFSISDQQFETGAVVAPVQQIESDTPYVFRQALDLSQQRVALIDSVQGQAAVYDFSSARQPPQMMSFASAATPHAQPVLFDDALLLPRNVGEISLLDFKTGGVHAHSFQPGLGPTERIQWTRPVLVKNGRQFVIGNNRNQLFRILLKSGKESLLTKARTAELNELVADIDEVKSGALLRSQLAALDDHVFVVMRGISGDVVLHLDVNNMKPASDPVSLEGRVVWGPKTIGQSVFVVSAAENQSLICFQADGKLRWKSPLQHGALAGPLVVEGSDFLAASIRGVVWKIQGNSGEEVSQLRVAEALASGPRLCDGRLLLSGASGSLYLKEIP